MSYKRLIPCIFIYKGKAIKWFDDKEVVSDDVIGLAKQYCDKGADELIVFDLSNTDDEHDEAIDLVKPEEGIIEGVVTHLIFKGVHYEMEVLANNYELLVHSTDMFPVGTEVGIRVDPFDIQIMKKPESEDAEAAGIEE